MIASLQRQIASLQGVIDTLCRELAESRGEPSVAQTLAAAAVPAASTKRTAAAATKRAAPATRAAPGWQLAGGGPSVPPPLPPGPRAYGREGQRSAELGAPKGCICRSWHLPDHPFVFSQPGRAHEDIKVARGNIVLWGVVGVEEGSAPPPPPQKSSGGLSYAAVRGSGIPTESGAGGGTCWPRLSSAPAGSAHSWALLPPTTAVQPHRLYHGEAWDRIREWGIT